MPRIYLPGHPMAFVPGKISLRGDRVPDAMKHRPGALRPIIIGNGTENLALGTESEKSVPQGPSARR